MDGKQQREIPLTKHNVDWALSVMHVVQTPRTCRAAADTFRVL